jgi:hypothetical protein
MQKEKIKLTEKDAKNSPAGGVVVGKRNGQTMIYDDASVGGYFVGKTHAEGGIKMINKSNGQPLEVQGAEVIITAPAVADQTKSEFNGKMMTNREILSEINVKGGGVAFAKDGMEIPKDIKRTGASYNYGGKTMTDHEIYKHITGGHLAEGYSLREIASIHQVPLSTLKNQVRIGMKAESEHTSSKREQMQIVKDHLFENPKYYTLLKKAGLEDGGLVITKEFRDFDPEVFNELEDEDLSGYLVKDGNKEIGIVRVEEDILDNGVGYILGLEVFEKKLGYGKKIVDKIFELHPTQNAFGGKATKGSKSFWSKLGAKFDDDDDTYDFILEKNNLKYNNGGRVYRGSLVRDSKSGNTPARDLNNYNDMLDVEADGQVGGDTGLFLDGGMMTNDVQMVSTKYLNSIRSQGESNWDYDLENSIEINGVKEPVIIGYWEEFGKVSLLDGHHRLDASMSLGINKIPAIIVNRYDYPYGKVKLYDSPIYIKNPKRPSDLNIFKNGGKLSNLKIGTILVDNDNLEYHQKLYRLLKIDDEQFEISVYEYGKEKDSYLLPLKMLKDFKLANEEEIEDYERAKNKTNNQYVYGGNVKQEEELSSEQIKEAIETLQILSSTATQKEKKDIKEAIEVLQMFSQNN